MEMCIRDSLHPPAHLHRPVIPQEPPDLPGDLGYSIGGELGAEGGVVPPHRLQKSQAAQLIQVVRLHAAAVVAAHNGPDQPVVLLQHLLTGPLIPLSLIHI